MNEIRVIIADDHQMFIDGIKSLLRNEKHIRILSEVNDGKSALEAINTNTYDLLITDVSMGEMSGVELTKIVKHNFPELKVLVLSMHNEKQIISEILLAEAEGYVLKNTGKEELLLAINTIIAGDTFYSKEVLKLMLQSVTQNTKKEEATKDLTERELEIILLIVQEYSTPEIAELLFISPRTVETHRKNIMQKLNTKTIVGLMKFAFRNNLTP
jgi:DNA-binding NarL/FixJ family response regulator